MTTVPPRAASPSLPSVVLHAILEATAHGKDVAAFLNALPAATLSPELVALRDLGAVVDLAKHWPCVGIARIPIEYAHLAIAALPAFQGVCVDAGFPAIAWLDAQLPPKMPVTLVVDASVPGALTAFAYNWGGRITTVLVKGHAVQPDPVPDILTRCVNVQCVTIENVDTPTAAAAYLKALQTTHLHTLAVRVKATGPLDTTAIVAWLQGSTATSLSLACSTVLNPTAFLRAVRACFTLSSLTLDGVSDVHGALSAQFIPLRHVTALSVRQSSFLYNFHILGVLDPTTVRCFSLQNDNPNATFLYTFAKDLATCASLESLRLENWTLHVESMTGVCPRLSDVTLRRLVVNNAATSVPKIIQWLSTSRCLASLDLSYTVLGREGVLALARALPAWMARGLQTLQLSRTGLTDKDALVLAVALVPNRNRRPLTIDLTDNKTLTIASAPVLLTTLGACYDVTLMLNQSFALPAGDRRNASEVTLQQLVSEHNLQYLAPGTFMSPTRTTSPWHLV